MKKVSILGMVLCVFSLLVILGSSNVFGQTVSYGYALFRDLPTDLIKSDGKGEYVDCHNINGEDEVEITTNADGSLSVEFHPSKLYHLRYDLNEKPSTRKVNLCFNVSGLAEGAQSGPAVLHGAARDILTKYKSANKYTKRPVTKWGWFDDGSAHLAIMQNKYPDFFTSDHIQLLVDPLTNINRPGTDLMAITQSKVDGYYPKDKNFDYWITHHWVEPVEYVGYRIDYQSRFDVKPISSDTWILEPIFDPNKPPRLCVYLMDNIGNPIETEPQVLYNYPVDKYPNGVPFAIAVSLVPFSTNPFTGKSLGAPPKSRSISATWGEIKGR